jgi:glycosyltransferase involved in cell wall biosynthesis
MPAWNAASYVEEAVDSVLAQTYENWELVIVDDHSIDETPAILERLTRQDARIRVSRNEANLGEMGTRNAAIARAVGPYAAFIDSDDQRKPASLELQVAFMEQHPGVVAVGTGAEWCDENMNRLNDRLYPLDDATIRRTFFRHSPFCLPSLMIRTSAFDTPAYDVAFEPAGDLDAAMRLGTKGELANLPDALYRLRTHRHSVTRRGLRTMEKNTFRIRRKAVREYGYRATPLDVGYNLVQFATMYLMPTEFRFKLFNRIRASA